MERKKKRKKKRERERERKECKKESGVRRRKKRAEKAKKSEVRVVRSKSDGTRPVSLSLLVPLFLSCRHFNTCFSSLVFSFSLSFSPLPLSSLRICAPRG